MPAGVTREAVARTARNYDTDALTLAVIASHSAIDVCDGAADEGLRSLAVCQRGRETPYTRFLATERDARGRRLRGCVDDTLVLEKFADVLSAKVQKRLLAQNAVFVPNRSLTSYCSVQAVERDFSVPLFGNRAMLRVEDRGEEDDYYALLEKAGLPFPEPVASPEDIDRLVIVKLHHAEKKLERGFFTAASHEEYKRKSKALLSQGVITKEALAKARIERYIVGPVFNLDFFRSPLAAHTDREPIELLGIDWRFESSLDGHVRLPAPQQMGLVGTPQEIPEMTVVGHNSATLRESLLYKAFDMAEKFVEAARRHYAPGVIGPFCLQTCVDKDMNFYIYDVAPRVGGGTNIHMNVGHPYGNALWREPMSTGRRIAREVKTAAEMGRLKDVVT